MKILDSESKEDGLSAVAQQFENERREKECRDDGYWN